MPRSVRMPWGDGDVAGGPYLVYGCHYYQVRADPGGGWSVHHSTGVDTYLEPVILVGGLQSSEHAKAWAEQHLLKGRQP